VLDITTKAINIYLFINRLVLPLPNMQNDIVKLSEKAVKIITNFQKNTKIRVISHYDADGITSAAIICKTLYRAGFDFHATLMRNPFDKGLAKVSKEDNDLIIFTDMGSGQIDTIEKMECKSIIIDHHQYLKKTTTDNVLQINANLCEINGNYEACGATMSFMLAKTLDSKNEDLVALAISGATGDKQYIGNFRGFNKKILDEALKNDFIKESIEIKLYGETLFDALFYSVDPYYSGISGNNDGIMELFNNLKLEKNIKIKDLDDTQKRKLNSLLMLKLIEKGCEKNILDTVIRPRYFSNILNCELERFADLLDSCGKGGNRSLGLTICMDDKKSFDEAIILEKEYKQKILDELLTLEKDGFKEMTGFRYFYSKNSSLGGVIGGIATNFILDKEKPLVSIVKKDDEIHVSCRGNQHLVNKGLDLGFAMNEAAKKLNGHGGGHKIAAGATISSDKEKDFLEIINDIIVKQLKG
jgi:RecJ-like exonuclease